MTCPEEAIFLGFFMVQILDMGIVRLRQFQGELDMLLSEHQRRSRARLPAYSGPMSLKRRAIALAREVMDYERWLERMIDDIYRQIVRRHVGGRRVPWLKAELTTIWRSRKGEYELHQASLTLARVVSRVLEYEHESTWSLMMLSDTESDDGSGSETEPDLDVAMDAEAEV